MPLSENGAGKDSSVFPNRIDARAMKPTKIPRVTMTALSSGPFSTGRMMTRSTMPPITKPDTRAASSASQ